ncbi:undecaprenyl-diphosphate phosphatase [Kalamiella sp. sgz302252]|uniref:undecaprenyl-diphosphate phosphatase n=1 Tax=Pantoea sp. sgz302252 TaxID=3341827 RepID=UPI0036D2118D
MEALNRSLFLWINATPETPSWLISLATLTARDLITVVPVLIVALWLWGPEHQLGSQRRLVLKTAIALGGALTVSWLIGSVYPHPRPFVMGVGHQFLAHDATESYPSNHGTIIFTFAIAFLCWHRIWSGIVLLAVGLAIAWSRIFLGVHWPMDMLGGLLLGMLSCLAAQVAWHFCGQRLLNNISVLYRLLFAFPIRKGWVRE